MNNYFILFMFVFYSALLVFITHITYKYAYMDWYIDHQIETSNNIDCSLYSSWFAEFLFSK